MHRSLSIERPGLTWFVSRHAGAIEWAERQGLLIGRREAHLDPAAVTAGDTVIGTLPVNLAAEVCARGARYLHLSLEMPQSWRGRELSAEELMAARAKLKAFHIEEAR